MLHVYRQCSLCSNYYLCNNILKNIYYETVAINLTLKSTDYFRLVQTRQIKIDVVRKIVVKSHYQFYFKIENLVTSQTLAAFVHLHL